MEEGEKEKLQQNGEASSLALGKVDAGEGELMLSPAQTPQVMGVGGGIIKTLICLFVSLFFHNWTLLCAFLLSQW